MAHSAVGAKHMKNVVLECPRDHSIMKEHEQGEAVLDVCQKCHGQFFDTGEMFGAFGVKADPSIWDRPEAGGSVRDGNIKCPRCHHAMLIQDVKYEAQSVEIDRCRSCGGIWLDKGEVDQVMAIGEKIISILEDEKAMAKEELDKMGDVDFSPGIFARFFKMFQKKG